MVLCHDWAEQLANSLTDDSQQVLRWTHASSYELQRKRTGLLFINKDVWGSVGESLTNSISYFNIVILSH